MNELSKHLSCALSVLLLSIPATVIAAESAKSLTDVQQRMLDTAARLDELDAQIADGKAAKSKLQKALEAAQSRVGEREQRLQGLESDIEKYDAELDSLDDMLSQARMGLSARQQTLAQALRDAQIIGKQTALKIVLQNDDPALSDRLAVYTDYILSAQEMAIQEQVAVLSRVEAAQAHALKERNWLSHIQNKARRQREDFASLAEQKQLNLGEVEAGLSQKSATVAELRADQARLQALLEELQSLQGAQSGYFLAGKGTYNTPVAGTLSARFGDIKSVGKLRWSGLFIQAPDGAPVKSVADGEVIYSDWLQGFGMLVIVDHGDNYSSLYAGNRDVMVPVGEWVETGATIATVGDSGGQSSSGLYFEIRHNAQAVDPEAWLQPDFAVAIQ